MASFISGIWLMLKLFQVFVHMLQW
ncbi:unnamed protein product [Rhodiola kirilowii]